MDDLQKNELIKRIENEHGVHKLFLELGLQDVSVKGNRVYCVCPMHDGADSPTGFCYSNGYAYCFTKCNRSYDLFEIVKKVKGCNFTEAINYLASLVGMQIDFQYYEEASKDSAENREFLFQIKKARKKIAKWEPLEPCILNTFIPKLHSSLRGEGYDDDVRDYFSLGYAQSGYLEQRITIPIDAIDGSIVTVSGRSIFPDDVLQERHIRRYQIWYDTEKAVTLYNISRALTHIEITGEVIVVEGFKSVWRLHQWGIDHVVAAMGSSLSDDQKRILLKLGCRIIVSGDRDVAGNMFNRKIAAALKKYSDVYIMDMQLLNIDEHSSIDNITKEQFDYLYENKKSF